MGGDVDQTDVGIVFVVLLRSGQAVHHAVPEQFAVLEIRFISKYLVMTKYGVRLT